MSNWKETFDSYLELSKPRILGLVLVTVFIGFYLGGKGVIGWGKLFFLMWGVSFVCAGSAVLNHYIERDSDAKMKRTQNRPLPAGKIEPHKALLFGVFLVVTGIAVLYVEVNILTAFLSLLTTFLYVLVYTPMKKLSWLNTSVGAVPGALPPLGGWAAATGTLDFNAGMLFLIMFIWQHPHFYSIAWIFREDYERGGFKMLPVIEPDGKRTFAQVIWFSTLLVPVSLIPVLTGMSGMIYFTGALIAGVVLWRISYQFTQKRSVISARQLLKATVIYLPILLCLIVLDVNF